MTAEAASRISDLQFTETYRVPFQYSRLVREHLGTGAFMASSSRRHRHRRRRQRVLRSRPAPMASTSSATISTKGASPRPKSGRMRSARCLVPITPSSRTTCGVSARSPDSTKSPSTCVRHGSVMQAVRLARYHTRRSHLVRSQALSRLVGRRAARRQQPGFAARDLHAGRHVRTHTACPEDPPRHRLRAGQPAAGAASECRRARRFALVDSSRRGNFDRAAYGEWLKALRRSLHRARHRA